MYVTLAGTDFSHRIQVIQSCFIVHSTLNFKNANSPFTHNPAEVVSPASVSSFL